MRRAGFAKAAFVTSLCHYGPAFAYRFVATISTTGMLRRTNMRL